MSFNGQRTQSFIAPLVGKTATFLLESRLANLEFARSLAGTAAKTGDRLAILDLDALYSSSAGVIFRRLPEEFLRSTKVRVPIPGSDTEKEFAGLLGSEQSVLVVDSLNSLYHLISQDDGGSRTRKLTFAISILSHLARTNGKAAILTMYKREGLARSQNARSISSLSDITASVEARDGEIVARCERGNAWSGGTFSIRIP